MASPVSVMLQKEVLRLKSQLDKEREYNRELRVRLATYEIEIANLKRNWRDHFEYVVRSAAWSAIDENEKGTPSCL